MKLKASIIITYYNQPKSINIVLESLKNQVNINNLLFEIIIVNDGSSPIENIISSYPTLNVRSVNHSYNKGRSAARNSGVKNSKSDLLIFIDGDRFLCPNFIYSHLTRHSNSYNKVVIGDIIDVFLPNINMYKSSIYNMFYDSDDIIWKFTRRYNYANTVFNMYDATGKSALSCTWISMFSGNFSIPKQIYEDLGGFDEDFINWGLENIDFGYRLKKKNINIEFTKSAVNFHIYHQENRNHTSNIDEFYRKHNFEPSIKNYSLFIQGLIPLSDISTSNPYSKLENIYFSKHKLGPRYKFDEYERTVENVRKYR